jgi:hypothetical protein
VLEFFQLGVAVGGQHLSVSVHVDSRSFGLDEQVVEIVEIVSGNQNGGLSKTG